jgi:hypothetical protein
MPSEVKVARCNVRQTYAPSWKSSVDIVASEPVAQTSTV